MEEEARHAASRHWSKHADPRPLYTADDALHALDRFRALDFDEARRIADDVDVTLVPAGHILGAAGVRIRIGGR